jgi:hypothetical protein
MTEPDDITVLPKKLTAIEHKRKVAEDVLMKHYKNERGHFVGYSKERAISAMIEFAELINIKP